MLKSKAACVCVNSREVHTCTSEFRAFFPRFSRSIFQMCYDCLIRNLYYQAWCGESAQPRDIDKHSCVRRISARFININFDYICWEKAGKRKGLGQLYIQHIMNFACKLLTSYSRKFTSAVTKRGFFPCGMSGEIKELSQRAPHNIQFQKGIKMYMCCLWTICEPKRKTKKSNSFMCINKASKGRGANIIPQYTEYKSRILACYLHVEMSEKHFEFKHELWKFLV